MNISIYKPNDKSYAYCVSQHHLVTDIKRILKKGNEKRQLKHKIKAVTCFMNNVDQYQSKIRFCNICKIIGICIFL